jgi:serine/threonine protein kinase
MVVVGIVIRMKDVHTQGLVHRDLMPANIVLDKRDYPRVSVIRSSCVCHVRQTMTPGFGTMLYAGHEMYDSADCTAAVDAYSFAMIVHAERQSRRPSWKSHPPPDPDHRLQEAAIEMLREWYRLGP